MKLSESSRVFVAGHRGLVGSGVVRALARRGVRAPIVRARAELDLLDQAAVRAFFRATPMDAVVVAAARVGGIRANSTFPADFLYENLVIETNVIHAAADAGVEKLLFLGSSCIYPRLATQPLCEDSLLTGPLEPTNQWYALAKIAGLKLCEAYRLQHGKRFVSAMPTNLYGPGDNFDPLNSHVIPGLLRRFHRAARAGAGEVRLWGTGAPRREFLHVDDLAEALLLILERYEEPRAINVGTGEEVTIRELAGLIAEVVGFRGAIKTDPSKPDGTPRKVLDSSRIRALGWAPRIPLRRGLEETYRWALERRALEGGED